MPFFFLSNTDFQFDIREFTWRSYIATEILSTTSQVELIDKRKFAKAALDKNLETLVIYIAALEATEVADMAIHPSRIAQIAAFQWNRTPIKILAQYAGYADVFSFVLTIELLENTSIDEHAIKLVEGKQPPYRPIYALSLVEVETLQTKLT